MSNKIKTILIVSTLLLTQTVFAQINTSSPYSRFGIGDVESEAYGPGLAMGGIGIGTQFPFEINTINPASYSGFPIQSFIFQAGIRVRKTDYSSSDNTYSAYDNGLKSLAVGFNINKYWSASAGLKPYSSIGYKMIVQDTFSVNGYNTQAQTVYLGEGGLNKAYFGNSISYKGLSIGVNASYIFGTLKKQIESSVSDTNNYAGIYKKEDRIRIKDFSFDFGLQYTDTLAGKYKYTIGAVYCGNTELKAQMTSYSGTLYVINNNVFGDTLLNDTVNTGNITIPQSFGFGASFRSKKWLFAIDWKQQDWTSFKIFDEKQAFLIKSSTIAAGIEFSPGTIREKNFLKTVNYRIGGRYSDFYVSLNDTKMKDKAISFGFGIPVKKSNTKINLGFEIGQRGTTDNNLIKENYYTLNLNFNMGDIWFIKRKFN